jgi:hypothetical protein
MKIKTSEITFLRKTKYYLIEDGGREIEIEKCWSASDNEYDTEYRIISVEENGEQIDLTEDEEIELEDFISKLN